MKIKIKLNSVSESISILIDSDISKFLCNKKEVKMDIDEFYQKLINIIGIWKTEYYSFVNDALSYKILLENNNDSILYTGQGDYPTNFIKFINLLEEVKQCTISNVKE